MNPILPSDVDGVLDADVFVCVPITDYEVGQPTLRHIKENNSSAIIVLDAPRSDDHADPQRRTPPEGMGRPGRVAAVHRHPQDEPRGSELDVARRVAGAHRGPAETRHEELRDLASTVSTAASERCA